MDGHQRAEDERRNRQAGEDAHSPQPRGTRLATGGARNPEGQQQPSDDETGGLDETEIESEYQVAVEEMVELQGHQQKTDGHGSGFQNGDQRIATLTTEQPGSAPKGHERNAIAIQQPVEDRR